MPDTTLSSLSLVGSLTGTDLLYTVTSGNISHGVQWASVNSTVALSYPTSAQLNKKRFILCSGQSNFVNVHSCSWAPAANAFRWNNSVGSATSIGTAFTTLTSSAITVPMRIASVMAEENPQGTVYLLNCALGGVGIASWLPSGSPDVYANIAANIVPAMAAIGVSEVDTFFWWQGESDIGNSAYYTDFETLIDRLKTDGYLSQTTQIVISGIVGKSQTEADWGGTVSTSYRDFSNYLQKCASKEPNVRVFTSPSLLDKTTYWDPAALYIHLLADGQLIYGKQMAQARLRGLSWAIGPGIVFNREKEWIGIGTPLPLGTQGKSSPQHPLDVYGQADRGIVLKLRSDDGLGAFIHCCQGTGLTGITFGQPPGVNGFQIFNARTAISDGTLIFAIDGVGRVSIGGSAMTGTALSLSSPDPTRGILVSIANAENPAATGCLIALGAPGIATWAYGINAAGGFSIYASRTAANDGTEHLRLWTIGGIVRMQFSPGIVLDAQSFLYRLAIAGNDAQAGYLSTCFNDTTADLSGGLDIFRSRSATIGTSTIVQVGDELGHIGFWGSNGSTYKQGAKIRAVAATGWGTGLDAPAEVSILTTPDASDTPIERLRIGHYCMELTEQTAPSAPAANKVRIYSDDSGGGKTRLMALFPSGVAQQIAIEP